MKLPAASQPRVCLVDPAIHEAPALLPVARVDAGRAHRNPNLAGARMWIGKVHDLEDLRTPELLETDCLHHFLRSRHPVPLLLGLDRVDQPDAAASTLKVRQ